QLRAGSGRPLSERGQRARRADPGAARRPDVRDALALGRQHRPGAAALSRRQADAAAAGAHGRRGPDRLGISRSGGVRREPGRRTQAVMARRWLDPAQADDLGRLDPEAITRVRAEAWPEPTNAEELHDALVWLGCLPEADLQPDWRPWLAELAKAKRAAQVQAG